MNNDEKVAEKGEMLAAKLQRLVTRNDELAKSLWLAKNVTPVGRSTYLGNGHLLRDCIVAEAVGKVLAAQISGTGSGSAGTAAGTGKTRAQLEAEYASIPANTMEGARQREIFRQKFAKELGL